METSLPRVPKPSRYSAIFTDFHRANKARKWLFDCIRKLSDAPFFDKTLHRGAYLRAHYNWTSLIFGMMFVFSVSSWFGEAPITCIEHYQRNRASATIEDICVQFPYTRMNKESLIDGQKYYALYYTWVHWICLFLFLIFKSLYGLVFMLENKYLRKLLIELNETLDYNYRLDIVQTYYKRNYGCHMGLVKNRLILNSVAIAINMAVFFGIDIFLVRNYWKIPVLLAVTRDCTYFDDQYSILFPTFAYCDIDPLLHIQVGRSQLFGCYLPLNEVYGKFFIALWFWQIFLQVWGILSILYWMYVYFDRSSSVSILDDGSYRKFPRVKKATMRLSTSEALALSLIKEYLFGPHYRTLVCSLTRWQPSEGPLTFMENDYNLNFPDILTARNHFHFQHHKHDTIATFLSSTVPDEATALASDKLSFLSENADHILATTSFIQKKDEPSNRQYSAPENFIEELKCSIKKKSQNCPPTGWAVPIDKLLENDNKEFFDQITSSNPYARENSKKIIKDHAQIGRDQSAPTERDNLTSTAKKPFSDRVLHTAKRKLAKKKIIFSETITHAAPITGWPFESRHEQLSPIVPNKTRDIGLPTFTDFNRNSAHQYISNSNYPANTTDLNDRSSASIGPTAPILVATTSCESDEDISDNSIFNGKETEKKSM